MNGEEYYVYPILDGTDYREHTPEHPFCGDMSCPCHEDAGNMADLAQAHADGLIGSVDGDLIYRGRTI